MEEAVKLIVKMWTEPRTTLHGRYFHVEDAILEPKPVQRPRPPVLIAGSSEQLTLRAVARLADACNFVDAEIAEVRHKLAVLADIATPRVAITTRPKRPISGLGFSPATTPRWRRSASDWLTVGRRGGFGTVSEAIDLIGQYRDAGIEVLIHSDRWNDIETRELFVSDVMPHFA